MTRQAQQNSGLPANNKMGGLQEPTRNEIAKFIRNMDRTWGRNNAGYFADLVSSRPGVDWSAVYKDWQELVPNSHGFDAYMTIRELGPNQLRSPEKRRMIFENIQFLGKALGKDEYLKRDDTRVTAAILLSLFDDADKPQAAQVMAASPRIYHKRDQLRCYPRPERLEAAKVFAAQPESSYNEAEMCIELLPPGKRLAFAESVKEVAQLGKGMYGPLAYELSDELIQPALEKLANADDQTRLRARDTVVQMESRGTPPKEIGKVLNFLLAESSWDKAAAEVDSGVDFSKLKEPTRKVYPRGFSCGVDARFKDKDF